MSRTVVGGLIALLVAVLPVSVPAASDLVGYGGVGFRGGSLLFLQEKMTGEQASPRLSGDLVFSYVYSDHILFDLTVGYGWNRLDSGTEDFWLVSSVPITLGARYEVGGGTMRPYLGAGGGFYVWTIHSKDLGAAKDPVTKERLRRADLGVYGMLGIERTMSKHIGATADASYHYILSENVEDFPSGYNGNKGYVQARLGISFYFTLSERIDTGLPE